MSERLTRAEREADLELAELDDLLEWSELVTELESEDDELGWRACDEARRILAETEPDWPAQCVLFVGSMNGRREFVSADWLRDRDWLSVAHASRAALAESLAAFCALEQLQ